MTWEQWQPWFRYGDKAGLYCFKHFTNLSGNEATIALRTLKFQLEERMGQEISDDLFEEIFKKVCNFHPRPAFGAYAKLEFIEPLKSILQRHGVSCDHLRDIHNLFRINTTNPRRYKNLLLHIPHSSTQFSDNANINFNDLESDERLLIDYYTDELFLPSEATENISSVVFPYCRLCCDVERLVKDPLEQKGLGIVYSRWLAKNQLHLSDIGFFFGWINNEFGKYVDYHASVAKKIVNIGEGLLLIDCHSFSALPNLLNHMPPDIDICIGYNDDATCPNKVTIGIIAHHFRSLGYRVAINKPFSNSKTFDVPIEYHSVKIVVNKQLYMDENCLSKTDGFEKLRRAIETLYAKLLGEKIVEIISVPLKWDELKY